MPVIPRNGMVLFLSDDDRKSLKRLMYRCLEDIECDRSSYKIGVRGDRQFGRIVRDGKDITRQVFIDEENTRAFLRRLG